MKNNEKNKDGLKDKNNIKLTKKESTYKITYDMFFSGKDIEQIVKERNLAISTIQGHFMKFLEEKWENYEKIDKYLFETQVKKQYIDNIVAIAKQNGIKSFKVIKNKLPEEVSYFEIRYVVWKYDIK